MKRLRKSIAAVLLGLLVYNIAGYVVVYFAALGVNAERVESVIAQGGASNAIVRIAVPLREGAMNRREFRIDDKLYDAVRTEVQRDTLVAWCVRDNDEERIDARLVDHVARSSDTPTHDGAHIVLPESPVKEFRVAHCSALRLPVTHKATFFVAFLAPPSLAPAIPTPPPRG